MTDRPIPFSTPMVRALLEGRKTQTRRVLKPQPIASAGIVRFQRVGTQNRTGRTVWECHSLKGPIAALPSAPGCLDSHAYTVSIGDRLWVRERASWPRIWDEDPLRVHVGRVYYDASAPFPSPYPKAPEADHGRLKAAMHLPREFSRLTLHVEAVRVQRLLDISDTDAQAEGVYWNADLGGWCTDTEGRNYHGQWPTCAFEKLWDTIHGDGASDANPWVAAITFRVEHKNIDANPTTPTPEPTP